VPRTAYANGEVIVSGGAFNSPQLLQLSGLGPAKILRDLGIEVIADMPGVGADLQDHLQIRMQYRCTEPITMNDVINHWRHRYGAGLRYIMSRKGLLTIGAGYAGAFLRTRRELATPDVQIHFLIFSADAAARCCMPFPDSWLRYASCGRRVAASCASSRATRACRQRSSHATFRRAAIAIPWSPE
jgi:choline dehydrogenase